MTARLNYSKLLGLDDQLFTELNKKFKSAGVSDKIQSLKEMYVDFMGNVFLLFFLSRCPLSLFIYIYIYMLYLRVFQLGNIYLSINIIYIQSRNLLFLLLILYQVIYPSMERTIFQNQIKH